MIKIGIIREGKVPADKRVAFSPAQCAALQSSGAFDVTVQPSPVRAYTDAEYAEAGIKLSENLHHCDILFGIKEVPVDQLIPHKSYLFFSHTIKKQAHNQKLMKAMLDKHITLFDYECLRDIKGNRILGFGYYAGIVGAYNGIREWGIRNHLYSLKPANQCFDYEELCNELSKANPGNCKILLTGSGRVGHGAMEIMEELNIKKVSTEEYLNDSFEEPVFCHINYDEYYRHKSGRTFDKGRFKSNPEEFESDFNKFTSVTDIYISCHYWDSSSPRLFKMEDIRNPEWRISVIADITCDIDGSIPTTLRSSTIASPSYGVDQLSYMETDPYERGSITVMAVDNLPCELPRSASEYFGNELIVKIMPLISGEDLFGVLSRATIVSEGELTDGYSYLSDYAGVI
jgi:alanine dehydrogenase